MKAVLRSALTAAIIPLVERGIDRLVTMIESANSPDNSVDTPAPARTAFTSAPVAKVVKPRGTAPLSEAKVKKIKQGLRQRMTYKETAAFAGVSMSSVARYAQKVR